MSVLVNKARRLLINFGKLLPFIICFIIAIAYIENIIALYKREYLTFNDGLTLNTPLSFWIAQKVQYDWLIVFIAAIIGYAVETCVWNKLATTYLALQLIEKYYLSQVELYPEHIAVICVVNIIISAFFVYKGLQTFFYHY